MPYADIGLKPRRYDPQQSKTLLEKAGWVLPAGKDIREKNGQPLRVELSFIGTDALSKSMAEIIQADMRQLASTWRWPARKKAVFMPVSAMVASA